jgi:uncharacterized protein (TIGR02284 family)
MTTEYDRGATPRSSTNRNPEAPDANRDPITGAPGAHPIGTGIGAATGGAAGAAIGAVGGPIGAAIGATTGAIAGGLAGKGAGEAVNPTAENEYWRANYVTRSYVQPGAKYDAFEPAYRYGWESYSTYAGKGLTFDQAEPDLRDRWAARRGGSSLDWSGAREAVRDAWTRIDDRWRSRGSDPGRRASEVETKSAKDVRESLNDLIQICKDGSMGFRLAADKVAPTYSSLFTQFAAERDAFVAELQDEVRALGGEPADSGDATGALHRGWINIKSALTSGDKAIIDECERGEDAAVEAYQKALRNDPPPEIYALVARQYSKVKSAHDRVSAIKHSLV